MRRHVWSGLLAVLLALAAVPASAQRSEEEAGDVSEVDKDASGPLRSRIRPVSGQLFLMDGRFELSPQLGVSFRDAFFTKVLLGAALTYHFTESFAFSVRAAYAVSLISGAAQICTPAGAENAGCRTPTEAEVFGGANTAVGRLTFLGALDLQWAPIYGKLALFAQNVLYFNMYGLIGPAVVLYKARQEVAGGSELAEKPGFGGDVGLGFRFRLNQWLAVRLELRDTIFVERYYDPNRSLWQNPARNQLTVELGLSMFFPTTFVER